MGTITRRKRRDGITGYTVQTRIEKGGKIVHTESKTFDREQAARVWMVNREELLNGPDGLAKAQDKDPPLAEFIEQYERESKRELARTKKQVLQVIRESDLGKKRGSGLTSPAVVTWAQELGKTRQPQTSTSRASAGTGPTPRTVASCFSRTRETRAGRPRRSRPRWSTWCCRRSSRSRLLWPDRTWCCTTSRRTIAAGCGRWRRSRTGRCRR